MSTSTLFETDPDFVRKNIEKLYNRSEKSMNDDIARLKEWMQTQPHLPEILDDKVLQNFLIRAKFSIENTKKRIDNYYTMRNQFPEFFKDSNPDNEKMRKFTDSCYLFVFPKTVDGMYRVFFLKMRNKSLEETGPEEAFKQVINLYEIRQFEDAMFGDILLTDCEGITFRYISKWTPTFISKFLTIIEKIYSLPFRGIYLVNTPPFVSSLVLITKKFLNPKLAERINISEDSSIVQKCFDKTILPKDYGGDEISLEEIQSLLKEKLCQYKDRLEKLEKLRADESLRPEKLENDDNLGFHGNFKKLDLD